MLLCVPDRAIAEVARALAPGPWVAHVSGATPLAALDPHTRRFGLHPLQTFTRARGAEQLDGAFAAVTAESDEAREVGLWLARTLGLEPFALADEKRDAYHAGAAIASNYLVTLRRAAGSLLEAAGAPPQALDPLMRRTIENGFELTGPIARGDWATVETHVAAIRRERPELEAMYIDAAPRRRRRSCESRAPDRRRSARSSGEVGLVPTMGALHAGHVALIAAAGRECDTVVVSLFVNPAQFGDPDDLAAYPRDEEARRRGRRGRGGRRALRAGRRRDVPARLPDVGRGRGARRACSRASTGRATSAGVATVCLKLFNIVRPQLAYFGQKDAQQVAVLRRMVRDLDLDVTVCRFRPCATPTGWRSRRATPCSRRPSASALSRCRARSRRATPTPRAPLSPGSTSTTSRSPTSTHPSSPPPYASAPSA